MMTEIDSIKWGVWCVEDRRFCDGTIGTEEHARTELPRWQSGEASALRPDHRFHYEVCRVDHTPRGLEPVVTEKQLHEARNAGIGGFWHTRYCAAEERLEEMRDAYRAVRADNAELRVLMIDIGTDRDNPDTCGFCGEHFADCEKDENAVPADETEDDLDVPTGREFACVGARIRRVLTRPS